MGWDGCTADVTVRRRAEACASADEAEEWQEGKDLGGWIEGLGFALPRLVCMVVRA